MEEIAVRIAEGLSGVAGYIAGFDWELLFIWCLLMAIDIATGYLKACKQYNVNSENMRVGIYKKMLDTFSILAILLMQGVVSYLGFAAPIGSILIGAFCFKELTSILENTGGTGSMPKNIQSWLDSIKRMIHGDAK